MIAPSYNKALEQAKANANYFQRPYAVFTDKQGNWRIERLDNVPDFKSVEIVKPRRQKRQLGA